MAINFMWGRGVVWLCRAGKIISVRSKRLVLLTALFLCMVIEGRGQATIFPPQFYSLKTNAEKAAFLRKAIADSVATNAFSNVPSWSHTALALAGEQVTDSLHSIFYGFLGDAYRRLQNDSAAHYFRLALSYQGIPLLRKISLEQSLLYTYLGTERKDSIGYYVNELETSITSLPDTSRQKLMAFNAISQGYSALNRYEQSIKYLRTIIENAFKIKDSGALRNAFVNAGTAYNEMGNNRQAIYYTLQALPYLRDDAFAKMVTFANLADYYSSFNNIDSAKLFTQQAEVLAAESKDEDAINDVALRRAAILIMEKKYAAAEPLLKKSLAFYSNQQPGVTLVNCLLIYATLDTAMNNYSAAEKHLLTLYSITKGMNLKVYLAENLRMLAFVNEQQGDFKEAYKFQQEYIAVNDAVKTEKAEQGFAELQTQYQTYKKEEQIKLLQKESLIKELQLSKANRNKTLFIFLSILLFGAFAVILYIRQLRNKAAMQQVRSVLEMKALRSQMNPHFIFNSLNSIQKYIWENRPEDASEYLTKFARLIRMVLENSLHASVKLSDELQALQFYVEMEHRRNNQKFDYSITVQEGIDQDKIQVPPLLLQPYVENAIWHGLSPKDERGKLSIDIQLANDALVYVIEDNGIGRARSAEMRGEKAGNSSLGMNISSQRIAWLQKGRAVKAGVEIIDKFDGSVAAGTTVILTLPLTNKHA